MTSLLHEAVTLDASRPEVLAAVTQVSAADVAEASRFRGRAARLAAALLVRVAGAAADQPLYGVALRRDVRITDVAPLRRVVLAAHLGRGRPTAGTPGTAGAPPRGGAIARVDLRLAGSSTLEIGVAVRAGDPVTRAVVTTVCALARPVARAGAASWLEAVRRQVLTPARPG